jgi:hypothetical protein
MTEEERASALLTPSQREFLRGEKEEIGDRAKRANRSQIRQRIKHSLVDLHLLNEQLAERDLEQVSESFEVVPLKAAISESVAFLYRIAGSHPEKLDPGRAINEGIEKALKQEVESLYQRLAEGDESLTLAELKLLESHDYIDTEDIVNLIEFGQQGRGPDSQDIAEQLE